MAGNAANAAVWGKADVLVAPLGTPLPTGNNPFRLARHLVVDTTTSDATLVSDTDVFNAADVGASVSGPGIPAGATIASVTDAKTVELSAAATATATDVTVSVAAANGWSFVGILDGGQGFTEGVETQSQDHTGWGYGVIAVTYQGQKVTKTFTALEENETVMGLVYDIAGATFDDETGTYQGNLGVKDFTEKVLVAFVTRSGLVERRQISKGHATIAATSAGTESETALGSKGFTATIIPDANQDLWLTYKGPAAA